MPRRRFRDPHPQVRDRNMLDILGAPGMAGLSRVGGPAGGAQTANVVIRGGRQGAEGVQIEHVTLEAVASQTIASGGGTVQWDTVLPAPTEVRGFDTLQTNLASSGSVGDIPIDVTGVLKWRLDGEWASWRSTGTLTATLLRDGSAVGDPQTYDIAGTREFGGDDDDGWEVRSGDSMRYELSNDSGSGQDLEWATLHQLVRAVVSPTSTASGPTSLTDITFANSTTLGIPTSTQEGDLLLAITTGFAYGVVSGGDGEGPASASGWTAHATTVGDSENSITVLSKTATGADISAGSVTFTYASGTNTYYACMVRISGGTSVVEAVVDGGQYTSRDLTLPALSGATLLVGMGSWTSGNHINQNIPNIPSEFTVAVDGDGQGYKDFTNPSEWEVGSLVSPSSAGPYTFTFDQGLSGQDDMFNALVGIA